MTTPEAAAAAGCTINNIQAAIHRGRLTATKVGRDWHITQADFEKWLASPRKPGRPRKEQVTRWHG